jgi:GNAT superfamily N-acetyltransferase
LSVWLQKGRFINVINQETMLAATPEMLEQAVAYNHKELFGIEAVTLGGSVHSSGGLTWTMAGMAGGSMIPFPVIPSDLIGGELDRLIAGYLRHPPKGAGCWSLDPPQPSDLGVSLMARGFQPGWRPYWMALDMDGVSSLNGVAPDRYGTGTDIDGLTITLDNSRRLQHIKDLPFAQLIIPLPGTLTDPGRWARFVATLHGKVVAQSVVYLTTGPLGAAGIYNVGVVPGARRKGIGKAITLVACLYAKGKGYRYAVLNAAHAGRRLYEELGFTCVGEGWTWWLVTERLLAHPPNRRQIQLAEAVGRGDMKVLETLRPFWTKHELITTLTNGMTLMQLAVYCGQVGAGEMLIANGAAFTALDAWDMGWKERALRRLLEHPEEADQRYGESNKTLLHIAAERNDEALCRLALSARTNPAFKDSIYRSTALEWAGHFGHEVIARLIKDHKK